MKQKTGFNLRHICDEYVLVAEGRENIDFSNIISLNETAAFLWEKFEGKDFDARVMADLLCQEYDVAQEQALADSEQLIQKWVDTGLIE